MAAAKHVDMGSFLLPALRAARADRLGAPFERSGKHLAILGPPLRNLGYEGVERPRRLLEVALPDQQYEVRQPGPHQVALTRQ